MTLHRLPLLMLSVASTWLKPTDWCTASTEAEKLPLPTAQELTLLINSLKAAAEATVAAAGAVARLPSLQNATDNSNNPAAISSSSPGQGTAADEPGLSSPTTNGVEIRPQPGVPSGTTRFRSPGISQAAPTSTDEQASINSGLLPIASSGSTESNRSPRTGTSSRDSTTSRASRTPPEVPRNRTVSTTTTTTSKAPLVHHAVSSSNNPNITDNRPYVRPTGNWGGVGSSPGSVPQSEDPFFNGNTLSNGHVASNISVPSSNGSVTSNLTIAPSAASSSDVYGGISSEGGNRSSSAPEVSTRGSNGNSTEEVGSSTSIFSGRTALAALILKRQDALQRIYAKLLDVATDAAETLDVIAEEQDELNKLKICDGEYCI